MSYVSTKIDEDLRAALKEVGNVPEKLTAIVALIISAPAGIELKSKFTKNLSTLSNIQVPEEQPVQLGVPMVGGVINNTTPVLLSNPTQMMGGFQQVQIGGIPLPSNSITIPIAPEISITDAKVSGPATPVTGPMLAVDTSMGAFERDGIGFGGMGMGMNRMPRRNPFRSMGGMMNMPMMSSDNESGGMSQGGSSNTAIKVNKME
jgi:hypothetical protein